MDDYEIIELFWQRSEDTLTECKIKEDRGTVHLSCLSVIVRVSRRIQQDR
jgi:hypothetical protein